MEENVSLKKKIDIYLKEINQLRNNHNSLISKFNSDQHDLRIVSYFEVLSIHKLKVLI